MAAKVTEREIAHYIPSESDSRGRVALYLLKYLDEWIALDELTHPTVSGSAAKSRINELVNIGWPVEVDNDRFKLTRDPRTPLWQSVSSNSGNSSTTKD